MTDQTTDRSIPGRRWLAIGAAVLIPTAMAFLFWSMTPTVGGWGKYSAPSDATPQSAVDYSQNGRLPVGAAATDPKSLYLQNCASCHGMNLEGGRIGPALKRPGWPYGQNRDMLVKIIHQGRGLTMPGFDGRLNNQQIEAIATYLQTQNGVK